MVHDSWSRVTSVCDPSLGRGERKKDNIDGEKLFEEEYLSEPAIAGSWQIGSLGGNEVGRWEGSGGILNRFGSKQKRRRWNCDRRKELCCSASLFFFKI